MAVEAHTSYVESGPGTITGNVKSGVRFNHSLQKTNRGITQDEEGRNGPQADDLWCLSRSPDYLHIIGLF